MNKALDHLMLGFLITASGNAQSLSKVNVQMALGNKGELWASTYDPARFPAFSSSFSSELERLRPYAFVLSNRSPKAIVAIQLIWQMKQGQDYPIYSKCDDFLSNPRKIVAPGKTELLLAPGMFHPASITGPTFQPAVRSGLDWVRDADIATVSVDAVIFEDGELVGPDTHHYKEELEEKIKAAHSMAEGIPKAFNQALSLEAIASGVYDQNDFEGNWRRRIASMLLGMPPEVRGQALENFGKLQVLSIYRSR